MKKNEKTFGCNFIVFNFLKKIDIGKKKHMEIWKPESARKKQDVLHLQTLSEKTLGKKNDNLIVQESLNRKS